MNSVCDCERDADWNLHIDADMVLRAMGADPQAIRARQPCFMNLVAQIAAEQTDRLRPKAALREIAVRKEGSDRLLLENGLGFASRALCRRLAGSQWIVAVIGTIGDEFERCVSMNIAKHRLILDALGTAAITALTDSILAHLRAEARRKGLRATNPMYPGTTDWELTEGQRQIFALVDGRAAEVSLNEWFMMVPRKSVSFVIGVGRRVNESVCRCEDCGAATHCRHKMQLYAS